MPNSKDLSRSLEIKVIWTFGMEFPTYFNKPCTYHLREAAYLFHCSLFSDEVIILSASGTAAIVNLNIDQDVRQNMLSTSLDRQAFEKDRDKDKKLHVDVNLANQLSQARLHVFSDG